MSEEKSLISQEQEDTLSEITKEIQDGFKKIQIFRSEFLMRNSVLAMQATPDGQYWQAMLERNVHFWELVRLKYDYQEKICNIELKEAKLNKKEDEILHSTNPFDKAILQAESKKLRLLIERDETYLTHMRKEAEQRMREITTWTKIIRELEPTLKYSKDNPEECQAAEWAGTYAKKIGILTKTGSTDMDGTINTFLVGNKIFSDPEVIKLCENEKKLIK